MKVKSVNNEEVVLSRKQSIEHACARLFREKGYSATSMQDIAEALGIKAASLYNHISSKQDILHGLLQKGAGLFVSGMEDIKRSSLSPIEKLKRLIAQHIHIAIEHTDLMALMTVEWRHLEKEGKAAFYHSRNKYEEDLKSFIREAQAQGQLKKVDVELVAFSILTTLQRIYAWYDQHVDYNTLDLEKNMVECLIDGIRA